jgi:hypothetical protein
VIGRTDFVDKEFEKRITEPNVRSYFNICDSVEVAKEFEQNAGIGRPEYIKSLKLPEDEKNKGYMDFWNWNGNNEV